MKNKNLILFSYDFPPLDGGIARLCNEIVCGASTYYDSVTVLTRHKDAQKQSYSIPQGITFVEAQSKRIACEWECFRYLRSIKNKNDYDVICGLWHPEATIAYLSGFRRIFTLAHGTELLAGKSRWKKYFWLPVYAKFILGKLKGIIANSHYTENLAKQINPNINSVALPLAVNYLFFKPMQNSDKPNDKINLCSVSRILKFKGHDFILRTIAALPEEVREKMHYNIAGTGSYLPELKQLVQQLNLENTVSFFGFVPDSELPSFYNRNDLFILCTRESVDTTAVEGFGLVFLEAQACGIPAIGARTGGIPDAIEDGNGGWLIEQDNLDELAALLTKLINNPTLINEMGRKARTRVEKECTWTIYSQKLFTFLNS